MTKSPAPHWTIRTEGLVVTVTMPKDDWHELMTERAKSPAPLPADVATTIRACEELAAAQSPYQSDTIASTLLSAAETIRTLASQVAGLEEAKAADADLHDASPLVLYGMVMFWRKMAENRAQEIAALKATPQMGDVERASLFAAQVSDRLLDGLDPDEHKWMRERIATLCAQIRAEEREACAKVAEAHGNRHMRPDCDEPAEHRAEQFSASMYIAAAIREGKHT